VVTYGQFTDKATHIFDCTSNFVRCIFLKIHIIHKTSVRYKHCQLGCHRSVLKGNLPEQKCTVPAVSRLALQGFKPKATIDISYPSHSSIGREQSAKCSQAVWVKRNGTGLSERKMQGNRQDGFNEGRHGLYSRHGLQYMNCVPAVNSRRDSSISIVTRARVRKPR
jgi:hypothetical protein